MDQSNRLSSITDNATQRNVKIGPSKRVKSLKIALPLTVTILTLGTIIWTFNAGEDIQLQATQEVLKAVAKNELINPRFESTDQDNQPYTITASRAVRGETDDELIILSDPAGDILMSSGRWLAAKAQEGAYHQDKKRLILRQKVNLYDDEGYMLETEEMNIDLGEETILSQTPVFAKGPAGAIQATGLFSNIKTGLLSFTGPATLVLEKRSSSAGLQDLQ